MIYLKVKNLTKSYSDKILIDHIDFSIKKGQKIALVAKNGAGKTTLIKLLNGDIDKTDGEVDFRKGIKIGTLSQKMEIDGDKKVIDILFHDENEITQVIKQYEQILTEPYFDQDKFNDILIRIDELNAWEYESKVKTIVSKLKINQYLNQKVSTLSGGEKKRVLLAKVLADDPDFLILDEPTNHLDLDMIEWLEHYLSKSEITLLMVTHDRYFLERVCSNIFELDRGKLYNYEGNYRYFLNKKLEREKNEALEMKNLRKLLKQELAWMKKAPRARASKSVYREKKFYEIEGKYDSSKDTIKKENVEMKIEMQERRLGGKILKIHNLNKSFGDKKILNNFSHDFRHKERVGVLGKNGVGKTTFLNMIMGVEDFDDGSIKTGETVTYGYYEQKEIIFPHNKRVLDIVKDVSEFMYIKAGEKITATVLLERFLFSTEQQYMMADRLSGGEKRRLYLLTILMKNPNFLILDEPTNDLDLMTLSVLEEFLLQYQGCIIVVSHDRFFMDRIVDHLFVFEGDGDVTDFWGTYSEYKEYEKIKNKKSDPYIGKKLLNIDENDDGINNKLEKKKLSYMEKREFENLMNDIQKLEDRKDKISNLFLNPNMPHDEIKKLSKEIGEIIKNIETKEMRWLELSEKS